MSREQCRAADQIAITQFGIPAIVLMENAGRGCAEMMVGYHLRRLASGVTSGGDEAVDESAADQTAVEKTAVEKTAVEKTAVEKTAVEKTAVEKTAVVLCGPGNNGGDGFVIARHLAMSGWAVKVVVFQRPEEYGGDARTNLIAIGRFPISIIQFNLTWSRAKIECVLSTVKRSGTTWIIDALLGTGATGEPSPPMAWAIGVANEMQVSRMAIDIPTGLDCDSGIPAAATFRADLTCALIDQKTGFSNPDAREFLGDVVVVGIGAPVGP